MEAIQIKEADTEDVAVIRDLAHEIWWPTYGDYIPHGQISLMLEQLYSAHALLHQMALGQHFILATLNGNPAGFASYQLKPADPHIMRIEKLYLLPAVQGKGMGKRLIDHVAQAAIAIHIRCLELNVNRNNAARHFYEKIGFTIIAETDTPYHGYVLDDYVMQKSL